MKLKSILTVMALTIATTLPMTAMSKTTPIIFTKGSHCSAYEGNVIGKQFTLNLDAGQTLTVLDNYDVVTTIANVIVKDPRGILIEANSDTPQWTIRTKGQHTVAITPSKVITKFASVRFCAY